MRSVLALLFLVGLVSGARLYGTLYDGQLDPVAKVQVVVNSTPAQRMVAQSGSYAFTLPPGSYHITATKGNLTVRENLTLFQEGEYRVDLIFLPDLPSDVDELDEALSDAEIPVDAPENGAALPWFLWAVLSAGLVLAGWFFLRQHRFKPDGPGNPITGKKVDVQPPASSKDAASGPPGDKPVQAPSVSSARATLLSSVLTPDQKRVLKTLESLDNRAPQKELRKALSPWGEAKVSLELTELEDKGYLRKIKMGRGNVIRKT